LSAIAVADPNTTGAIAAGSVRGRVASIQAFIFDLSSTSLVFILILNRISNIEQGMPNRSSF
jgi:hypothetical protein